MRGLKLIRGYTYTEAEAVASFTDAWIETTVCVIGLTIISVASFTDAWIETYQSAGKNPEPLSHLLQMRGLKQKRGATSTGTQEVASFTDAWIETTLQRRV